MNFIPFNLEHAKAGRLVYHRVFDRKGGRLHSVLPGGIRNPYLVVWFLYSETSPTYDTHEVADLCHDADDGFVCPSDIAPGHNPDNLTNEIVGTKDGWRLLTVEEVKDRFQADNNPDIARWCGCRWHSFVSGDCELYSYRTKKPPGFFLKPRMKTVNKTVADLPRRPFWIMCMDWDGPRGATAGLCDATINYWAEHNVRYSETLDGPWLPFTKEIPE